jgi:3-hydroxyisobutyrate dehydrogenase-like beta-hydroxyacid dehydrogenase
MFTKVAVLGLGKVGHLAAELLVDAGFQVTGIDVRGLPGAPFSVVVSDLANAASVETALVGQEAVLSCLPYHLNIGISSVAHPQQQFKAAYVSVGAGFSDVGMHAVGSGSGRRSRSAQARSRGR